MDTRTCTNLEIVLIFFKNRILTCLVYCFVKVLECNNIVQAMNILEGLIPGEDAPKQADASHLEKLFVFCLMWSVGALLELEDRKKVLLSDLL